MGKQCFHLISLCLLVGIIIWDRIYNLPRFPYCFLYLTQNNLFLNTLYYLIAFILDYYPKCSHYLDKYYNFCFDLSFRVMIFFWLLVSIDMKTMFKPGTVFNYESFTLGFILHGGVFSICLLDLWLGDKRHKPKYINPVVFIFFFPYYYFLRFLYFTFGIRIYPYVYQFSLLKLTMAILAGFVIACIGHLFYIFLTTRNKPNKNEEKGEELIDQ